MWYWWIDVVVRQSIDRPDAAVMSAVVVVIIDGPGASVIVKI